MAYIGKCLLCGNIFKNTKAINVCHRCGRGDKPRKKKTITYLWALSVSRNISSRKMRRRQSPMKSWCQSVANINNQRLRKKDKTMRPVTALEIEALGNQQQWMCFYTGVPLRKETPQGLDPRGLASVDHTIPTSKGGKHTVKNLTLVSVTIQAMKGTLNQEDFIRLCNLVAKHHPRKV